MEVGDGVRATRGATWQSKGANEKLREEGELSSSDNDDAIPPVFAAPSSAAASNRAEFGQGALLSKTILDTNFGRSRSNCERNTRKNRAPFVPFVIRFSDDDSGSESEELTPSNPSEIKRSTESVKENVSRLSLGSTLTSSITNISRQTSKNGGHLMADQRSSIKNLSSSNQMLVAQKHGSSLNLESSSSKLQDLRQQIEMREREIKSIKQSKESGSVYRPNYNVSDSEIDAPSKRSRAVSSDDFTNRSEVRETDRKRLKLSEQSKSAQREKQVHTKDIISSGPQCTNVEKGVEISITGNLCDVDKMVYPSNSSEQTKRVASTAAKSLSKEDAFVNDARLNTFWDTMQISSEDNGVDMNTLIDIEEMQEKELEKAQEHRHKCEVEERNALRAYRNAQRALIEANARCSLLYRKRELCSAYMQSLMIENPKKLQLHKGMRSLKYTTNDIGDLPMSSHQMLDQFGSHDEDLNIKTVDSEEERNAGGQQLVANDPPFSEPDDSTSTLQKEKMVAQGAGSVSTSLSGSSDEDVDDAAFSFDKSADSHPGCRESTKVTNIDMKKRSVDTPQDSLVLEAALRSQLFARLGTKASFQNTEGPTHNLDPAFEPPRVDLNGDQSQSETINGKKTHFSSSGGVSGVENMSPQILISKNGCQGMNFSSNRASASATDLLESFFPSDTKQTSRSFTFSWPILMSTTFVHLKVANHGVIVGLKNRNRNDFNTCDTCKVDDTQLEKTPTNIWSEKVGYYTSNVVIDPFRPLCMFELRGKCNNDECPSQHIKDYSSGNVNLDNSENLDSQVDLSKFGGKLCMEKQILTPPTYLVSLDLIKADSNSCGSLPVTNVGQCWQKCLSTTLVISCRLTSDLSTHKPLLHGSDARFEVHASRNNQSQYFRRTLSMNKLDQQNNDNDQILEVALLNLCQEVDKRKGRIEALKVLARAVEVNPSSVILWVAYLHIYHSAGQSVAKDDMFCFAVELNQGSYELWLIYINTRMQVEDRFTAYSNGLFALCGHTNYVPQATNSACILDLFLQYLDFSRSSGNISRADKQIYEISLSKKKSDSDDMLLLSNILPCLTPSDKCIFWFCCIYFTVYKKLPDAIVQRFEFQKELDDLEWAFSYLTSEEKHQADILMEMAVDSLALVLDDGTLESESAINVAHMFAINHVKCIAVLEGSECSRKLLDNYMKIYPSCLELVLMSAQTKGSDFGDSEFVGFEDALKNWEEQVPGVQCIWNQYINFALRNGRVDFAKQLMDRWFCSVWQVRYTQSASAFDVDSLLLNSSSIDVMFGLVNLSLFKSFDNDLVEARLAIDGALKSATTENYKHCVKEHFSFVLSSWNAFDGGLLDILKNYLVDHRAISTVQPLSRKFIEDIKKPRVRNLVSNIWTDLSLDFSLVNAVLEVFYGPSLLPHFSSKLEDLVDTVEALMEISPANYRLAISVGKLLNTDVKLADVPSVGVSFWATSLITGSLFQAVPIPPESTWIEAADTLSNLTDTPSIMESFHKKALMAYPLSLQLWKSYVNLFQVTGNTSSIIAAAKERGVVLD